VELRGAQCRHHCGTYLRSDVDMREMPSYCAQDKTRVRIGVGMLIVRDCELSKSLTVRRRRVCMCSVNYGFDYGQRTGTRWRRRTSKRILRTRHKVVSTQ
jgi:hypothetical protein